MEFPNTGWYLLSTISEQSWNDAKTYWNLTYSTIYQYIYELSGVPIPNETQLTNNNWTPIDISNNNPSLKPYKGYWVNITSITRVFSGTGELTEATVTAQLDGATIVIIEGYTSIGANAFSNASSLTSVTFEAGSQLTSIGNSAFYNASSLTSITIPASVRTIESMAFQGCSNLTSITFAEGSGGPQLTSIGSGVFIYSKLTSIIIPASVTSIGAGIFYQVDSLTSVTFAEGSQLTSIGEQAFYEVSSLTSITIPEGVTSIGVDVFFGTGLTEATINVDMLVQTNFPAAVGSGQTIGGKTGVNIIGYKVFTGTGTLSDAIAQLDGATIVIIEGYTSIGNSAFYNASSLTSITIPASVTSIGNSAFQNATSLTSITIPEGVTSIGEAAFQGASSLTSVTLYSTTITILNSSVTPSPNIPTTTSSTMSSFYNSTAGTVTITVIV